MRCLQFLITRQLRNLAHMLRTGLSLVIYLWASRSRGSKLVRVISPMRVVRRRHGTMLCAVKRYVNASVQLIGKHRRVACAA
eukprot:5544898-Pleurochrysis_carterae.AAC.2